MMGHSHSESGSSILITYPENLDCMLVSGTSHACCPGNRLSLIKCHSATLTHAEPLPRGKLCIMGHHL